MSSRKWFICHFLLFVKYVKLLLRKWMLHILSVFYFIFVDSYCFVWVLTNLPYLIVIYFHPSPVKWCQEAIPIDRITPFLFVSSLGKRESATKTYTTWKLERATGAIEPWYNSLKFVQKRCEYCESKRGIIVLSNYEIFGFTAHMVEFSLGDNVVLLEKKANIPLSQLLEKFHESEELAISFLCTTSEIFQ